MYLPIIRAPRNSIKNKRRTAYLPPLGPSRKSRHVSSIITSSRIRRLSSLSSSSQTKYGVGGATNRMNESSVFRGEFGNIRVHAASLSAGRAYCNKLAPKHISGRDQGKRGGGGGKAVIAYFLGTRSEKSDMSCAHARVIHGLLPW